MSRKLRKRETIPHSLLCTSRLEADQRFDAARESVSGLYRAEPGRDGEGKEFGARIEGYLLDGPILGRARIESKGLRLSKERAYGQDSDPIQIWLYTKGGFHGTNGGEEMVVRPGDIGFVDLGYELEMHCAPHTDHLGLTIPRDRLLPRLAPRASIVGAVLPRESTVTRLLTHHLKTAWRLLPEATSSELPAISEGILDLIAASLESGISEMVHSRAPLENASLNAMRDYIEAALHEPALSPERLCSRFNCSRAYLYRLFQPLGGVRHYIQERRLHRTFRTLSDGGPDGPRVIDVAMANGFTNQSHFSQLFRRYFDITPSEAREAKGVVEPDPCSDRTPASDAPEYTAWLKRL